jgi:type I restriction enzyme, S subunit
MSFDWAPFTDLLSAIIDNRGRTCPVGDSGIPLIATNCVDRSNLYPSYDTTRFVSDETYRTWFRGHPVPGDILFVCKGSPGRTNLVPDPVDFCIAQDMVAVRANPQKVYGKYLFAALRSPIVQSQIDNMHVGTMIPHFKKGDFGKLNIPLPARDAQHQIGDFYFSMSERIGLLRETNATMEAIAQALFKSWFVDFDPVRAKRAGLVPDGMDEATAALFPDAFEESALGLVPKGWGISTLGAQTSAHGGTIQTGPFGSQLHASDYADQGVPVAMPKDILDRRISTASVARVSDEHVSRLARHKLTPGDIVFSRRGDVERHALVSGYEAGWLCGTGCLLVRPGASWRWPAYLSMLLDAPYAKAWLVQHAVGATMPNLNTGILGSIPVIVAPADILDQYEQVAMAVETKRSENIAMLQTLVVLRDTLLPRLISGQLRLPEAQNLIEEATA